MPTLLNERQLHEGRRNMNNESISRNSQTDWQRLDAMTDDDIDLLDCPEVSPEMFSRAVVRRVVENRSSRVSVIMISDAI
jgi:hypothetical protein